MEPRETPSTRPVWSGEGMLGRGPLPFNSASVKNDIDTSETRSTQSDNTSRLDIADRCSSIASATDAVEECSEQADQSIPYLPKKQELQCSALLAKTTSPPLLAVTTHLESAHQSQPESAASQRLHPDSIKDLACCGAPSCTTATDVIPHPSCLIALQSDASPSPEPEQHLLEEIEHQHGHVCQRQQELYNHQQAIKEIQRQREEIRLRMQELDDQGDQMLVERDRLLRQLADAIHTREATSLAEPATAVRPSSVDAVAWESGEVASERLSDGRFDCDATSLENFPVANDTYKDGFRIVSVVVCKQCLDDSLGMDVQPLDGHLLVVGLSPEGEVDRANKVSLALDPMGDTLAIGDVVVDVNGITGPDDAMIAEFQQNRVLRILALRLLSD